MTTIELSTRKILDITYYFLNVVELANKYVNLPYCLITVC